MFLTTVRLKMKAKNAFIKITRPSSALWDFKMIPMP